MEENNRIFVDSNYFVALFTPTDSLHQKSLKIAKQLGSQGFSFVISNFVFLEVVTVISQKGGRAAALAAGRYFLSEPLIEVIHIDEELQEYSWEVFQRVKSKDVSFVDCSIMAAMESEDIPTLLTFDSKDFKSLQKLSKFSLYI